MAHETPEDIERLQRLLDESHGSAGRHLRRIFSDERRVSAAGLPGRLEGVQVLALATVTARGEPRVAPVDALFYRGEFWFGSAPDSLRFRNIRERPAVSATVVHGEDFAVVVHGTAHELTLDVPEAEGFRGYLAEAYDESFVEWAGGHPYARIEPGRMYSFGGAGGS